MKGRTLVAFDVDGTLETAGGKVRLEDIGKLELWGILSSRSRKRAREAIPGLKPHFIEVCRVLQRKEELRDLKRRFVADRYVYVEDREIDRSEAEVAVYEFIYRHELKHIFSELKDNGQAILERN